MSEEELAELERLREKASDGPWTWDGLEIDPDDGYAYAPQGSYLGETLITLGDTYEGSGYDCLYISRLLEAAPRLLAEIRRLRSLSASTPTKGEG